MGGFGKDDRDAEEAPAYDEWSIHQTYRKGTAEAVREYAVKARSLISAIKNKEHGVCRKDGTPSQKTKEWALYLANECAALEHPLPDEVFRLLAACLLINDPDKHPDLSVRDGKSWHKAVEYEAKQLKELGSNPDFSFASSSKVARSVWRGENSADNRKKLESWRKNPAYRRDVHRCWFRQNPKKVSKALLAALRQDGTA